MLLISTILYYSEKTNRFNMNSLLLCSITVLVKLISNTLYNIFVNNIDGIDGLIVNLKTHELHDNGHLQITIARNYLQCVRVHESLISIQPRGN
jgi:hypothetical protein